MKKNQENSTNMKAKDWLDLPDLIPVKFQEEVFQKITGTTPTEDARSNDIALSSAFSRIESLKRESSNPAK